MDKQSKDNKTFWDGVKSIFNGISTKVKLIIGAILGLFGFIAYFSLRRSINSREILKLELEKVRAEIEIEKTQEDIDINDEKIIELEKRAEEIIIEIEKIEVPDPERDVSKEELDDFFDKRGF